MAEDFITHYHDLLAAGDPAADWGQLAAGMDAQNLRFGTRYIANVLRPMLFPRARFAQVAAASEGFFGALATLYGWLMEDAGLRVRAGLTDVEEAALAVEPGFRSPDGIGRLDGFLDTSGQLRFVEYNADSPGGLAFGHAMAELMGTLPTMRRFAEHYPVTPHLALGDVLDTLLAHYREWGGQNEHPTIAIVDWEGLGTAPEFILCRDFFIRAGCPAVVTHPGALELRGGRLWDGDSSQAVDIVYKRVLVGELLEQLGLDNVLTHAMQVRAACVVNSYRAQLLFKKALFALLSEWVDSGRFPADQQHAIHAHLPWTRIVQEGATNYAKQKVDLLPFLASNRERFVLKPNSEYGGKGVVLGWESDGTTWEATLTEAIRSAIPWVVQERIPLATEPFPLLRDGTLQLEPRFVDLDPYLYAPGAVRGAGVRLGATGLLNVTAGGGSAVPLFLVG